MNATTPDPHALPSRDDGTSLDVVGIGNALVDVLSHEDESFIGSAGLVKGAASGEGLGNAFLSNPNPSPNPNPNPNTSPNPSPNPNP